MAIKTGKNNIRRRFNKKHLLLIPVTIIILIGLMEYLGVVHFLHNDTPDTKIVKVAGTPTKVPNNNSSASISTQNTDKTPSSPSGSADGRIVDTQGQTNSTIPSSQWITSTSGNITVKQPGANAKIQSGNSVIGEAKVDEIHYRLIDSKSGVIAQGQLKVVGGNFSGTLQFTPISSTGRLDIFSIDSGGVELNEVQISVDL